MSIGIVVWKQVVDIDHLDPVLYISSTYNLAQETDLELVVHAEDDTFRARIVKAEALPWNHKHNWRVEIECDQLEELRKALTYEVAGGESHANLGISR